MAERSKLNNGRSRENAHTAIIAVLVIYSLLLTFAIFSLNSKYADLQRDVESLKEITKEKVIPGNVNIGESKITRVKREVISSSDNKISELVRTLMSDGIRGPPGKDGKDGTHGRDGRDSPSLETIDRYINATIGPALDREWHKKILPNLPVYGGATYICWGRKECPTTSSFIYRGQMVGPDRSTSGGGVNYQCIPDDPQYDESSPSQKVISTLERVFYEYDNTVSPSLFSGIELLNHMIPCSVCEADKRVSKLMIPGNKRCPNSWTFEYEGYLSSNTNYNDGTYTSPVDHHRHTYECLDIKSESLTGYKSRDNTGSPIFPTSIKCEGDGSINKCPPYQSDKPLPCVVCTK